jgi:hypothetical protein
MGIPTIAALHGTGEKAQLCPAGRQRSFSHRMVASDAPSKDLLQVLHEHGCCVTVPQLAETTSADL